MTLARRVRTEVERTIYVVAGLPIALHGAASAPTPAARDIRRAFAEQFWHPDGIGDALELAAGLSLAPIIILLAALWFTAKNGPVIRRRDGKGLVVQFMDQLRLYASSGILGPWYYILSLHRDGSRRAPTFLQRCETKRGIYALLRGKEGSPLGQKHAFAERCAAAGVPCVPCELIIGTSHVDPALLPDCDLFVKPLVGRGGRGAERWDRAGPRKWSNGSLTLCDGALIEHLAARRHPIIVQKHVKPHRAIRQLTSGATPTVRAITILNEQGKPEVVGTVFRMSFGANRTVDNIHAGGLACAASLEVGRLGSASDLGMDARLGWKSHHPTTGARIEGVELPFWKEVKELAVDAHLLFTDRVMIGWDIAITDEGPVLIEGNRGADMDLMQRFMETGFCDHRLGELIAWHLRERGYLKGTAAELAEWSVVGMDAQRQ